MSQQFMLLESNPEIGLKDGIYQDISEPFRDSLMPTGLSEAVLDVFAKADDKSLFSLDINVDFLWLFFIFFINVIVFIDVSIDKYYSIVWIFLL